jgi:hypothetical protein
MILAIEAHFAALENPNAIDYYSEVIEGMSLLAWDAMVVKRNVLHARMSHFPALDGPTGLPLMSPGS